jgi:hypothetical protein
MRYRVMDTNAAPVMPIVAGGLPSAPGKKPISGMPPMPPGMFPVDGSKHVAMKGTFSNYEGIGQPVPDVAKSDPYSPLTWDAFFDHREMIDNQIPLYRAGTQGHMFICLHGAGHSAMSFATFADKMKSEHIVWAFDFRGHGGHYCDNETDLSEETLVRETIRVMEHIHKAMPQKSINLCGHSMGGSIATKTAQYIQQNMQGS